MDAFNRKETSLLLAGMGQIYFEFHPNSQTIEFNSSLLKKLAINFKEPIIPLSLWLNRVYEADRPFFQRFITQLPMEAEESEDFRIKLDSGEYIWLRAIGLKRINEEETVLCGFLREVTNEKFYRFIDSLEMEAMSLSLKDSFDLASVVELYLKRLQTFFPGMMATVLKIHQGKVFNFASPNRLFEFALSFSGFPIGPMEGSCGAAAYTGLPVIVEDVFTDPRWEKFKPAAVKFNFSSCWSQPIFDANGNVLATFAIYSEEKRRPTPTEQNAIARSQQLLSLLFTKHEFYQSIKQNEVRNRYINMAANDAIYEWDAIENKLVWGESFGRLFGYNDYRERSLNFEDWVELIHPEDKHLRAYSLRSAILNRSEEQWEFEFRFKKLDGSYAYLKEIAFLLRDDSGKVTNLFGVLRDQTESHKFMLIRRSQAELAELFRSQQSIKQLLPKVLAYLSRLGNFSNGEFWQLNEAQTQLFLLATFRADSAANIFYHSAIDKIRFGKGEGLPGKTWQEGFPQVFNELKHHPEFVRADAAIKANLTSAFGFPILNAGKLMGVILFTSKIEIKQGDPNVEVLYFLGEFLGSEITRKLQEEEKQLLFQSSPEIMGRVNREGYILTANPAFTEILGFPEHQVIGRNFMEFIHPDEIALGKQLFEAIFSQIDRNPISELRCKTAMGEYRWIAWDASLPYGYDGFVFLYGRDIHEEKMNREALILSEQRYSDLFNLSPLPMWVFDKDTTLIIDANEAALEHYGYTKDEFIGMSLRDIRPVEEIPKLEEALQDKVNAHSFNIRGIFKHKKKSGEIISVQISTKEIPIMGHHAKIALALDITQALKRLEQLKKQNASLREIAWVQSHVVRAPLARLMGLVNLLVDQENSLEDQAIYYQYIKESANELDAVIKDVVEKTQGLENGPEPDA